MLNLSQPYKKKLNLKQYNRLTEIQRFHKYFLFSRYYDLTMAELAQLKNHLRNSSINFFVFKKSLLPKGGYNLKGQGPILLFYCNHFDDVQWLVNALETQQKVDPLFLSFSKNLIPITVLKQYCSSAKYPFPYILRYPLMHFYWVLIRIRTFRRI